MYIIGIDGGGSHSMLMAQSGRGEFGPYSGGSTNINTNAMEEVLYNIRELLNRFFVEQNAGMEDVDALCIGSAGVDVPEDVERMKALLEAAGFTCPVRVVNDTEIILEGELRGQPGVVLISGAGSVALGKDADGHTHRAGGWGHLVGDEGSAYWIAREAISSCLMSYDGRRPPTLLTDMLCGHFGAENVPDIINSVYDLAANRAAIAGASRWVDLAAERGDSAAIGILSRGADALYALVEAVFHQLELPADTTVIFSGGTLENSTPLQQMLLERLAKLTRNTRALSQSPCLGALHLAKKLL